MCMCMYVLYVCIHAYICTIYQSALSCFKIKLYKYVMLCYNVPWKNLAVHLKIVFSS